MLIRRKSESAMSADASPQDLFEPRTSVILCGSGRSLLNWVAYGLVLGHPGGFLWGHVRLEGEVLEDTDLLKTSLIRPDHLIVVAPKELERNEAEGNVAISSLIQSEGDEEASHSFVEFLRLPHQTQQMIAELPPDRTGPVLVLSGAHRLHTFYPPDVVGPIIRELVEAGGPVFMLWADAPNANRLGYEHILHLKGEEPSKWREAFVTVERGWPEGPLQTGAKVSLRDLPSVAAVLGKTW